MMHYLLAKLLWYTANLGNLRIAVPIAAILFVWLCALGRWRTALCYATAVVGCMATMFVIKLGFFTGHLRLPALGLENPSGHGAMSAVVYGSLAWVLSREVPGWRRRALVVLGCAGVGAIAASLYVLRMHTLPDVVAGLVLGGMFAAVCVRLAARGAASAGRGPVSLVVVIAVAALGVQGLPIATPLAPSQLPQLRPAASAPA